MKNCNLTNKIPKAINRYFKITRSNQIIDTSESFSILDNQVSREYFENEIYRITFTTLKETYPNTYELFLSSNGIVYWRRIVR